MYLPTEIINYCLLYANTGTKLIYNYKKKQREFIYDELHPKFYSILRLFTLREIEETTEIDARIIHLPWLLLSSISPINIFFVANITIQQNNIPIWTTYKLYIKKDNTNNMSSYKISYNTL